MITGTAYKTVNGKWVSRIEVHHQAPEGRRTGGISYYYRTLPNDPSLVQLFAKAADVKPSRSKRSVDQAVILPASIAALFNHAAHGLTPYELPA